MARQPTVPVFDIGGVLLDWNPRHLFRKLMAEEAAVERFLTDIVFADWNAGFDAGIPFAEGVAALAGRFPHHRAAIEAYDTRWQETIPGPVAGTPAILEGLKARGRPVYAITNFSAEKLALERRRWPFLNLFDGMVVSAELGILKPDPRIFRHLLDRFGLAAEDCLFIDDLEKNVAGARAVGMHAVQFTDAATLRAELARLGLL